MNLIDRRNKLLKSITIEDNEQDDQYFNQTRKVIVNEKGNFYVDFSRQGNEYYHQQQYINSIQTSNYDYLQIRNKEKKCGRMKEKKLRQKKEKKLQIEIEQEKDVTQQQLEISDVSSISMNMISDSEEQMIDILYNNGKM